MRQSNFPLRLAPSLLEEAREAARTEGITVNQLINIAVGEKLAALRTAAYFQERAARANVPNALRILAKAGTAGRPVAGDELPGKKRKKSSKAA